MSEWDAICMLWQILDTYEPGSRTRKAIGMGIDALMTQDFKRTERKQSQRGLYFICTLSGIAIGIMFMMTLDIIGMK